VQVRKTDTSAVLEVTLHAAVEAANDTGKKSAVIITDWHRSAGFQMQTLQLEDDVLPV
jgi:hypothetical protein